MTRRYPGSPFPCWELSRAALLELTGLDIGPPGHALRHHTRFRRLAAPECPCLIIARSGRSRPHAGVFYRGRMLHIRAEGVRYERLRQATFGYSQVRFYRCESP